MKNMLFGLMLAVAFISQAQTDSTSVQADTLQITDFDREQAILINLIRELSLTESQLPQVAALLTDRTSQIAEVRANASSDDEKREQIKQINLAIRMQLKEVISAEQLDIYISLRRSTNAQREALGISRNSIDQLVEDF